ncbi:MAG TPA: CDP-alcohol phosphatidyltransferase family protein [Steroidobacteraceae bacterium]|nr:CDP-alcohol phosphatidyltransferase family protein [Steroidobacteraceae bacterium]
MSMARAAPHGLLRSALICILAAALLIGAVAEFCTNQLGLGAAYVPKVLTVFIVGAALVLFGLPKHHPFGAFGAANQVTLVRGALVALLAGLIREPAEGALPALVTAVATGTAVLDGVDGWLARRSGLASAFGARFDMETDALLILVLAVLAWQFGKAGSWVWGSGLLRYAFVAAGTLVPALRQPLPPSQRRKIVAVAQVVALIVTVAPFVPAAVSAPLAAVALGALALSFLVDIVWLFAPHEANTC